MNTHESISTLDPHGKENGCARFTIEDVDLPFTLTNIAQRGQLYTFSCWLKSDTPGSILIGEQSFSSSSTWTKHAATFTATEVNLPIKFETNGVYYIYRPQLEIGSVATDWTPAPEDVVDETREIVAEESSIILDAAHGITMAALESYVRLDEYGEFKESVTETILDVIPGQIDMKFTEISNRAEEIDGELTREIEERSKHLSFSGDNAICIGGTSSGIILIVDNDNGIIFSKIRSTKTVGIVALADETTEEKEEVPSVDSRKTLYQLHNDPATAPEGEWLTTIPSIPAEQHLWIRQVTNYDDGSSTITDSVAFGSWNGTDFYTGNIIVRVTERAQFGNFAFIPRTDGSLSFLKVGG